MFQYLIGRLKTRNSQGSGDKASGVFQYLIGRLKTHGSVQNEGEERSFNTL